MSNNQKLVTVKVTRDQLIDLFLACIGVEDTVKQRPNKWTELSNKLYDTLRSYDSKHKEVD